MDTHDRHVLAHIKADGDFIAIRTFSRAIGRRGRFLILWEHLREWLETHPERSFYDRDCGHYLHLWLEGGNCHFTFSWLSACGDWLNGHEQRFELPLEKLMQAVYEGTEIRHLYMPAAATAKVELSCQHDRFAPIAANGRLRRAFSKAMRDCFQWPGELVRLSPDGSAHFYFTTRSGFPACGGLILHESAVKTPCGNRQKLFYSIHT